MITGCFPGASVETPGCGAGVGIGVGTFPYPVIIPDGGVGCDINPGVGGTLGVTNVHEGTLQHEGSLGSGTRVQVDGKLVYLRHLYKKIKNSHLTKVKSAVLKLKLE